MNDPAFRPAIAGKLEGMEQYDVVFVGFPIWWYSAPMAIFLSWRKMTLAAKASCCSAPTGQEGLRPA